MLFRPSDVVRGRRRARRTADGWPVFLPVLCSVWACSAAAGPPPPPTPPATASFAASEVVGLYVIGGLREPSAWVRVLGQPGIKGASLSEEWKTLEPLENVYEWTPLDADLRRVAAASRRVGLRLLPGVGTPEWVYAKGARRFGFVDSNLNHAARAQGRRNATYGQSLSLPVPWDEPFLRAWEGFVAAAGTHFRSERAIAMVHVTGPNKHSAEMILPRTREDREQWQALGYSPAKLIEAWERSIDAFARAFPTAALVLDLSPAIMDDGVVEKVADYAFDKYGSRVFMQNNILLSENADGDRVDWGVLRRQATRGVIGFQRQLLRVGRRGDLDEEQKLDARRQNFEGMFKEGIRLGARYFEIGAGEARDFPNIVERVGAELAKRP